MSLAQIEISRSTPNPLDILEAMFTANEWLFERSDDDEIIVETCGGWCDYRMHFVWRSELHALYFTCSFDLRIPPERRARMNDLLAMINAKMWMGHFDFCHEVGAPTYRNTVPTRGLKSLAVEQLEDMMDIALAECERFYPAFQYMLWAGHTPEDAIAAALLDCVGEA